MPIGIGREKTAVLRNSFIDVKLSLTDVPDPAWTRAFTADSTRQELNRIRMGRPRVQQDKIVISVRESDLMAA